MKINRDELIKGLLQTTERCIETVTKFRGLSPEQLNYKEDIDKWSILECIEHLNLYGDFYIPEIEKRLMEGSPASGASMFHSGLIGNWFAGLMRVNNGQIKRMKSPKDKNPANSKLSTTTLERFLKQQERIKSLLQRSADYDHSRIKCSISLTPYIKLRLGDTFRVVVYHNERHVIQAENVLKNARVTVY